MEGGGDETLQHETEVTDVSYGRLKLLQQPLWEMMMTNTGFETLPPQCT